MTRAQRRAHLAAWCVLALGVASCLLWARSLGADLPPARAGAEPGAGVTP